MNNLKRLVKIFLPILCILFLATGNLTSLIHRAFYNLDALPELSLVMAQDDGGYQNLRPLLSTGSSERYQQLFPCIAGSFGTWLAIQNSMLETASDLFESSDCVQERYTFPNIDWKLNNQLLTGGIHGWSPQRQFAIYTMFLNAMHSQNTGDFGEALKWFQRGLVLAPGRIPDYIRQSYYLTVAELYAQQQLSAPSGDLVAKAACLARSDLTCLEALPRHGVEKWPLFEQVALYTEDDWQLTSLEIDRDILALGLDVQGYLHWQRTVGGQLEQLTQSFLVPNLAPNAGFEIDGLFTSNCVSGYVSSHLYVLPCIGKSTKDPYEVLSDRVAIIETPNKGYAITSSTFPVAASAIHIVGARLCADGDADALVGRDRISVTQEKTSAVEDVTWFFSQKTQPANASCWQQHVSLVEPSADVTEFRLRLQREGTSTSPVGRAMFDDVFFFQLPAFEE